MIVTLGTSSVFKGIMQGTLQSKQLAVIPTGIIRVCMMQQCHPTNMLGMEMNIIAGVVLGGTAIVCGTAVSTYQVEHSGRIYGSRKKEGGAA